MWTDHGNKNKDDSYVNRNSRTPAYHMADLFRMLSLTE